MCVCVCARGKYYFQHIRPLCLSVTVTGKLGEQRFVDASSRLDKASKKSRRNDVIFFLEPLCGVDFLSLLCVFCFFRACAVPRPNTGMDFRYPTEPWRERMTKWNSFIALCRLINTCQGWLMCCAIGVERVEERLL